MNEINLCVDPSFKCPNRIDLVGSKWIKNGNDMIDEGYPLQLDIELNDNCNFRCPNCPQSTTVNKSYNIMSVPLFHRLIMESLLERSIIQLNY